MKRFNTIRPIYQWTISIVFSILLILLLGWWIQVVSSNKFLCLLIFGMVPIIQFLITPLLTCLKLYHYYSPMVVSFGNNKVIDLHNGTSFDYLMDMRNVKPGIDWKRKMLIHYLKAFIAIINKMETGQMDKSITVRGSSYFISNRSAEKIGFTIHKAAFAEKINIVLNYFDLIWMYSLANGAIMLPNLKDIKTVKIDGESLIKKKGDITTLLDYLNKK